MISFMGCTSSDRIDDNSQNWHPYLSVKPEMYWNVFIDPSSKMIDTPSLGDYAANHLLTQSLAGLVHRAVQDGKTKVAIWMGDKNEGSGYAVSRAALHEMGIKQIGNVSALGLLLNNYGEINGVDTDVKHLIDGYILIDMVNNPESSIVGSNASHVFNGVIVDVRFKDIFDKAGYKMLYDATKKTTADAWKEFRDKCNNEAVVLMPVNTAELREFAIANNLFTVNLNHYYADKTRGDNFDLFQKVMEWLEPNSPVYGWDQGIDESKIADNISKWGNHSIPYDWGYNTTLTSVLFPDRQDFRVKNIDPNDIDYSLDKKFVSYYLSDGDNIQWMMGNFDKPYWYTHPMSAEQVMTYGVGLSNTAQIGPSQMANICNIQPDNVSLFNRCSYFFLDTYASKKDRIPMLKSLAEKEAKHMKMHGNRILGTVTLNDAGTPEALEGYKILIEANDELDGIIAIQYSPYADGEGRVFWFKNAKGWDIPVVCTKYSIWNTGGMNHDYEGSPAFIARKLKTDPAPKSKYSLVCIHCWSRFADKGLTDDELAENLPDNDSIPWETPEIIYSAGAAELCTRRLGDDFQLCNAQELIWRIRMDHNPEQTNEAMKAFKK